MRFQMEVTKANLSFGFAVDATGELVGTLRQDGKQALVTYEWSVPRQQAPPPPPFDFHETAIRREPYLGYGHGPTQPPP